MRQAEGTTMPLLGGFIGEVFNDMIRNVTIYALKSFLVEAGNLIAKFCVFRLFSGKIFILIVYL